MAENKIFAGPRVRRLRNGIGLTQAAMAKSLGISPSYLNLIERNQRPLTVQLILKLSEVHRIDPAGLHGSSEKAVSLAELKAVFADPLLAGELPGDQELVEIAEAAPNAAAGLVKLHGAYRELEARLSDLSGLLAHEGKAAPQPAARLPMDEVQEVLESRPNFYPALDSAAEAFHAALAPGDDPAGALRRWLREEHDVSVRVLPAETMPNWRRRFDRHSRRLFVSERLSAPDRLREIAGECVSLRLGELVEEEVRSFSFQSPEARRLARVELTRYAAHALIMPYGAFHAAAERTAYDVEVLCARFQVSFEQAASRLTSLQRAGAPGVPFFLMEMDHAGHRLRRAGARGFPAQRFGGGCVKLPVHDAFAQAGRVLVEAGETPAGDAFLLVARTVEGPRAGAGERPRRSAVLLGCDLAYKDRLVYGRLLREGAALKIGPACRLCERVGCLARAEPPLTRPLGLDEWTSGLTPFDFQ
ncbi:helix-turn-helix domain-containing protein [Aureimonas populi]|uniref:Short-chain fatty acyl-CoA regulator family protein n=1 Tax=Aureimonas populi TaxID=1701758 RepID=A0ABW5CHQ5_9HYPH|nr:XRE family transcriptional regulator [Aureimonas populi]